MDVCTLGLRCALLLSTLFLVTVSATQKCVPQVFPDMVIDISQAVARGARFTDPLSVISVEECLSACCMDGGGDLECNLLIFDARKGPGLQNCYIFHCPTLDSCPLLPSPGVLSYSLWSEPSRPGKHDPDRGPQRLKSSDGSKVQTSSRKTSGSYESGPLDPNLKKPSADIASQGSAKHYAKEEMADPSRGVTTQLLHLVDHIDQHLEKMETEGGVRVHHTTAAIIPFHGEVKKVFPDAKVAKPGRVTYKEPEELTIHLPTAAAIPAGIAPNRTWLRLGTAAPQPVPRTKGSIRLAPDSSQDVSGADVKGTTMPGGHRAANNGAPKKVDRPLPNTVVPALTTAQSEAPQMVTRLVTLRTSHRKSVKPNTETNDRPALSDESKTPETPPPALREPPRKADNAWSGGGLPSLEDKSGLVAALVFGMLFLIVVIGLVSRKVSEARRRHRYTKLDYLINGMYVDT